MNVDSQARAYLILINIIIAPYILAWVGIVIKLIEDGVTLFHAILFAYIWPIWVADLVYDEMLQHILENIK